MTKKSVFAAGLIEWWFVHGWVCNFAHMETIYIRLHAQNIKTVSSCPHYHTSTRKMANYNILYKMPLSLAPHKNSDTVRWFSFVGIYKIVGTH